MGILVKEEVGVAALTPYVFSDPSTRPSLSYPWSKIGIGLNANATVVSDIGSIYVPYERRGFSDDT